MEQDLATQSLSDPEAAKLLWERWMHLEKLLIATLFAMFITTTVGLFTAAGRYAAFFGRFFFSLWCFLCLYVLVAAKKINQIRMTSHPGHPFS